MGTCSPLVPFCLFKLSCLYTRSCHVNLICFRVILLQSQNNLKLTRIYICRSPFVLELRQGVTYSVCLHLEITMF